MTIDKEEEVIFNKLDNLIKVYNRNGDKITYSEYAQLLVDDDYKVVKQTEKNGYIISTVWLGIDHSFGRFFGSEEKSKPIIFETMIFKYSTCDLYQDRYATEEEAIKGHKWAVDNLDEIIKGEENEDN